MPGEAPFWDAILSRLDGLAVSSPTPISVEVNDQLSLTGGYLRVLFFSRVFQQLPSKHQSTIVALACWMDPANISPPPLKYPWVDADKWAVASWTGMSSNPAGEAIQDLEAVGLIQRARLPNGRVVWELLPPNPTMRFIHVQGVKGERRKASTRNRIRLPEGLPSHPDYGAPGALNCAPGALNCAPGAPKSSAGAPLPCAPGAQNSAPGAQNSAPGAQNSAPGAQPAGDTLGPKLLASELASLKELVGTQPQTHVRQHRVDWLLRKGHTGAKLARAAKAIRERREDGVKIRSVEALFVSLVQSDEIGLRMTEAEKAAEQKPESRQEVDAFDQIRRAAESQADARERAAVQLLPPAEFDRLADDTLRGLRLAEMFPPAALNQFAARRKDAKTSLAWLSFMAAHRRAHAEIARRGLTV